MCSRLTAYQGSLNPNEMTKRRFHAPVTAFARDCSTVQLSGDEARHLRSVLRLGPGDRVFVFDGAGHEYECEVTEGGKDFVRLKVIGEVAPASPESPLKITLAVALLKSDKFDLVVQKATELGVSSIVPLETKLADIKLRGAHDAEKRVQRWQRIALEAAKQSGRALSPEVVTPVSLDSLAEIQVGGPVFFFSERGGTSLVDAANSLDGPGAITAVIGPEGGWTDEELESARRFGWTIVTFGGRTLRAETAAITVAALLQHCWGDLK
jgi:16S rRNA (uracil1498-N3)-methyltransferase